MFITRKTLNSIWSFEWMKSRYLPLVLTSIFYFLFFGLVKGMTGDDVAYFFPIAHSGKKLFDLLVEHYNSWSSRSFIEGVMILVLRTPFFVWKIITGLFLSVLVWSIYYIFFDKQRMPVIWVFCSLMVLCNFFLLSTSAGWVATTLNYIWPVAALFFIFVPVKLIEAEKKHNRFYYLLFFPFGVFALNQELFVVPVLIIFLVLLVRSIKNGKHEFYYYLLLITSLISLVFILTCPGNSNRFIKETNTWYPLFGELSLIQKSAIGIMVLFNYIVIINPFIFIFSSVICVLIIFFNEREKLLYRLISLIPLFCSLFVFIAKSRGLFFTDGWFGGLAQGEQYHTILQISKIGFIIISLFAYLLCLYIILKNTMNTVLIYIVIISGFISQLAMAFSPTVYASAIRTATLLFITLSITGTSVFSRYAERKRIGETGFLVVVIGIVITAFISGIYQIAKIWRM